MMEKVIANDMAKFLMILGAFTLGLSVLLINMAGKIKDLFLPYKRQTIIYGIICLLFFGVIALAGYPTFIESPVTTFIVFQGLFLLLGTGHVYLLRRHLKWAADERAGYLDLVYTLFVAVLGSIAFLLVYNRINKDGTALVMTSAALFFLVPYFFYETYRRAIAIPLKIIKEWHYPVNEEVDEPDDNKLMNPFVISFEFMKQVNDKNITVFRAKAPAEMEFGQLFYYFINDYNERNPNNKVQFTDSRGEPYGWIFYKKPDWRTLVTKYIDSAKTINNNRIRENEVIICRRSAD